MRDILGQILMQHSMGLADGVWVRVRCGVDEGCVKIRWIKTVQAIEGQAELLRSFVTVQSQRADKALIIQSQSTIRYQGWPHV
jgi:hypothetical protein